MRLRRVGRRSAATAIVAATMVAGFVVGGSGGVGASGSPVLIDTFNPFSGPTATFGFYEFSGCPPAAYAVNQAGGILGHPLKCGTVDTRGDPADAVLAAQKMLATTSDLVGVLGPSSDTDSATIPVLDTAHMTAFDNGGTVVLCHTHHPYFWRTLPADNISGYALALWAHEKGYKRTAAVFANDVSAEGNDPGVVNGVPALGDKLVANLTVTPDQTGYETEVQRIAAAHPQAIYTEMDPQTAGVFFAELKQAGDLVPIIGTSGDVGPEFKKALVAAIGAKDFAKYFTIVYPYAETSGPAWKAWDHALMKAPGEYKNPKQFANNSFSEAPYDDAIIMALAMVAAHSTKPAVYNKDIVKVTKAHKGAVVVHTFAAGVKALKKGKRIQYVGVTGDFSFNQYHCSPGLYAAVDPANHYKLVKQLSAKQLTALVNKATKGAKTTGTNG